MKTGPRGNFYRNTLEKKFKGQPPSTSERMRKNNPREYSRRVQIRALHRRTHEAPKFKKFGHWVRAIRKRLGKSQAAFAEMVGCSRISVTRWEIGAGHMPATWGRKNKHGKRSSSHMDRLNKLAELCRDLKKSGTPFEEER